MMKLLFGSNDTKKHLKRGNWAILCVKIFDDEENGGWAWRGGGEG